MSAGYEAIGWNRQKRRYDAVLIGGVALYLLAFLGLGSWVHPNATAETLLIRALGTAALLLLHVVLVIGPLCRLDRRFLPLLYNRRHLGVTTFLLAAAHGGLALFQFHALGNVNPLVSLLVSNTRFDSLAQFPFQALGLLALFILFLMAATSHDFWLQNLTPPVWKALHMGVYVAYALLLGHVLLGVLQAETSPVLAAPLAVGLAVVVGLHLWAAQRERRLDSPAVGAAGTAPADGFLAVCGVDEIPDSRARIVCLSGERVAVFRYGGRVSAISNVCRHQNGPLGEGKIVDGCVTCPWHGYQYLPDNGAAPAPFTEKVPTFRVRVEDGQVWVHPQPNPPGTRVEPARVSAAAVAPARSAEAEPDELYVGYLPQAPPRAARATRRAVCGLLVGAAALAVLLVVGQAPFPPALFEYDRASDLRGRLTLLPAPLLWRTDAEVGTRSAALLVAPGKFGAAPLLTGFDGAAVTLRGKRIQRGAQTMFEIEPGSVVALPAGAAGPGAPPPVIVHFGTVELRGEIVDGKCFLGVMNPGAGKPHRDCAVRCLAGGVPPLLAVDDGRGGVAIVLLAFSGGGLPKSWLTRVGEPLTLRGELSRVGDLPVFAPVPTLSAAR